MKPTSDQTETSAARILIVEDDSNICNLLDSYFSVSGFETESVGDGQAALERAQSRPFNLIVLDIMMPGLDRLSVCRQVRKAQDVPILLLTARGEEHDRLEGFDAGADDMS